MWSKNLNPQVLLYDGHDSHFDDKVIHILHSHHIKPFILKVGDSLKEQTNYNGPNLKLRGFYGQSRMNLQRQHGTLKFTTAHMNAVLVETWISFQLSSVPIIINAFKKKIVPLIPLD